jgi:hypothetical protein
MSCALQCRTGARDAEAAAQTRRSALQGREMIWEFLEEGSQRFLSAAEVRGVAPMPHGSREVVAVADGDFPEDPADEGFLNLVTGNDPRYGSALLVDTRGYVDDQGDIDRAVQPYPAGNGYEVFVFGRWGPRAIDFWRAETSGRFYA